MTESLENLWYLVGVPEFTVVIVTVLTASIERGTVSREVFGTKKLFQLWSVVKQGLMARWKAENERSSMELSKRYGSGFS